MDIIDTLKGVFVKISELVREMEPHHLGEEAGELNESDEMVKKLDLATNQMLKDGLMECLSVKCITSEEEAEIVECNERGRYMVAFDPLDGSSNIDCNAPIGTIFGIYEDLRIKGAGYCLYGGSTQLVYSLGDGVKMEQLVRGEWQKVRENYEMPKLGKYFSVNIANRCKWRQDIIDLVDSYIEKGYGLRYIGSLVGDGHRTLVKGGVFMYPSDKKTGKGKLRQYYEVVPFAFLIEKAGGLALNDRNGRILDEKMAEDLHYRSSIMLMGKDDFIRI